MGGGVADRPGEGQAEDGGADDRGQAAQALVGALQLALFGAADLARHQPLHARDHQAAQGRDGHAQDESPAGRREGVPDQGERRRCRACEHGVAFAEARDDRPHQQGLDQDACEASHHQVQADDPRRPMIAIAGIEHEHARPDHLRELVEEIDARQAEQAGARPQQPQGPDRIGQA